MSGPDRPRRAALGDGAVRVELPAGVEPAAALDALRSLPGVRDAVVTEKHACLILDDGAPGPDLEGALAAARGRELAPAEHVIRVRYDGPDLDAIAARAGLSAEEVVALHVAPLYTVRVVGFLPGFAYLGDVDPRIAAPRLPSPRVRVPAGAVGIAGARTAVYPFASPGGWNLVGTAVGFTAFDPGRGSALRLGDRVRFVRV